MVELNKIAIGLPRVGDKWLVMEIVHLGLSKGDFEQLNQVQLYFQVLFLSEILGAPGKILDTKYYTR